eukprot:gene11271-7835_t
MGLLTDERRQRRIIGKVLEYENVVIVVLVAVSIMSLPLLCLNEINQSVALQENALLPGMASSTLKSSYVTQVEQLSELLHSISVRNATQTSTLKFLEDELLNFGLIPFRQVYSDRSGDNLSNVYTIISPGGDGTEAIVIHAPIQSDNVIGIAAAMVLGRHIRGEQNIWAKDVVLLFTSNGHDGVAAWTSAYVDGQLPVPVTGAIESGLTLHITSASFDSIQLDLQGFNAQMPNMDLVLAILASNVPIVLEHQALTPAPRDTLGIFRLHFQILLKSIFQQAMCLPRGYHAALLNVNIPIVTVSVNSRFQKGQHQGKSRYTIHSYLITIENALRAMNNMGQRFNLSFTYYIILFRDRFVSISRYLPPWIAALLAILVRVMSIWLRLGGDLQQASSHENIKTNLQRDPHDKSLASTSYDQESSEDVTEINHDRNVINHVEAISFTSNNATENSDLRNGAVANSPSLSALDRNEVSQIQSETTRWRSSLRAKLQSLQETMGNVLGRQTGQTKVAVDAANLNPRPFSRSHRKSVLQAMMIVCSGWCVPILLNFDRFQFHQPYLFTFILEDLSVLDLNTVLFLEKMILATIFTTSCVCFFWRMTHRFVDEAERLKVLLAIQAILLAIAAVFCCSVMIVNFAVNSIINDVVNLARHGVLFQFVAITIWIPLSTVTIVLYLLRS